MKWGANSGLGAIQDRNPLPPVKMQPGSGDAAEVCRWPELITHLGPATKIKDGFGCLEDEMGCEFWLGGNPGSLSSPSGKNATRLRRRLRGERMARTTIKVLLPKPELVSDAWKMKRCENLCFGAIQDRNPLPPVKIQPGSGDASVVREWPEQPFKSSCQSQSWFRMPGR